MAPGQDALRQDGPGSQGDARGLWGEGQNGLSCGAGFWAKAVVDHGSHQEKFPHGFRTSGGM